MEIRSGKRDVKKRYGFRIGGGTNHVRYDHKRRPVRIDVVCPNCSALAMAVDRLAGANEEFSGDMSPSWDTSSFEVRCTNCSYRKNQLSYFELPPPFHQIYLYGERLWAWNLPHLEMIHIYLRNGDTSGHKYRFFETYIHGKWKKMCMKFAREIERHLSAHNLQFDTDAPRRST